MVELFEANVISEDKNECANIDIKLLILLVDKDNAFINFTKYIKLLS